MAVIHKAKRIDPDTQIRKAPPTEYVRYLIVKTIPWVITVVVVINLYRCFWP